MEQQTGNGRGKWPQVDFAVFPAAVAALWLGLGILLGLGPQSGLPCARPLAFLAAVVLLVVLRPVSHRWFLLFLPLGAALAVLHAAAPWRSYPERLPRRVCRVWLRGYALEPVAAGEGGFQARCRLNGLRTRIDGDWHSCRGTLLLRLPFGEEIPPYGSEIEAAGVLQPVAPTSPGSLFDYSRHLWKRGIVDAVEVDTMTVSPARGHRAAVGALYRLRARLAEALGRGMADEAARAVVQAMALGYRHRLPSGTRADFLASGTIHVFAISGLHVGIVALLATWTLAAFGVPLRGRSLLLVPLVGGYVLMCGSAVSAVRAWLMLSCWWSARLLQRAPVPANAVAAAAVLLLLWRPLALLETGFLFSFGVVLVLVLGWPLVVELVGTLGERVWWLPPSRRRHRWERWRLYPARVLAGASLAWFGSAGMMAQANGLLVPFGLVLNVGVMFLAMLVLAGAALKLVLSPLGWALGERVLAGGLERLAEGLCALAEWGSGTAASWRIRPLPPLLALLYYLLVFSALARKRRHRGFLLGGAVAVLLLPTLVARTPGDWVLAGADAVPPVLLLAGDAAGEPVVVNPGAFATARRVAARLEQRGVPRLEAMVLTGGNRDVAGGAAWLLERWPARTLVVPAGYARSASLRRAVERQSERGGRVRFLADQPPAARLGTLRLDLSGRVAEQHVRTLRDRTGEGAGFQLLPSGEVRLSLPTERGSRTVTVSRQSLPLDLGFSPDGD